MCPAGNNRVTFPMSCTTATVYKGVQRAENKSSTQSRLELFETFQSATAVKPTSPRPIQICKFQVYKASVVQMTVYFGGTRVTPCRKTLYRRFGGKFCLHILQSGSGMDKISSIRSTQTMDSFIPSTSALQHPHEHRHPEYGAELPCES